MRACTLCPGVCAECSTRHAIIGVGRQTPCDLGRYPVAGSSMLSPSRELLSWMVQTDMLTTVVRSPEAGPSQTTGNGKKGGGDLKVIDLQGTRWKA
jgi:hypothetical protein